MLLNAKNNVTELFNTVVQGNYCVGCGACASLENSPIKIELNEYGCFQAVKKENLDAEKPMYSNVLRVCPFSAESKDEDVNGKELFSDNCLSHNNVGYYLKTFAGYVKEGSFRKNGSSGGMVSWIATQLLKRGLIDAVVHVKSNISKETNDPLLFEYDVSYSVEEIQGGAKSRYYPVEMSEVLRRIKNESKRYVVVGLPCFIKAIRLLAQNDPVIAERVRFCIGLVCGHFKSTRFVGLFAWATKIHPDNLLSIDFRKKYKNSEANQYGVEIIGVKDKKKIKVNRLTKELYGSNWGHGFFKYQACDYCDDVVAEVADVTIGDAWLPQYVKDSKGTNILIIRNPSIQKIIDEGICSETIKMDEVSAEEVVDSQAAGFRHRRDGLAYRVAIKSENNEWCPPKRVKAQKNHLTSKQKKIYELRMSMASTSHRAFRKALKNKLFSDFVQEMDAIIIQYDNLYTSRWEKFKRKVKKYVLLAVNKDGGYQNELEDFL